MTVAAIVLAAGAGSRFVSDDHKLVVGFRGRPLAAWAIEAASRGPFDQVYVVTGAVSVSPVMQWLEDANTTDDLEIGTPRVTLIQNDQWADGQATSLQAGVQQAGIDGHDAAVVGLADQPLVGWQCWAAVASAPGPIVVATFEGKRRPPVKLESSVWSLLPRSGDEGARSLLKLRPDLVSEVACTDSPVDVDTMEDLRKWS